MATNEPSNLRQATLQILETLLHEGDIQDVLADTLDVLGKILNCEASAIWMPGPATERLYPVFHTGPVDLTNLSIENTQGVEGSVVQTGKPVMTVRNRNEAVETNTVFDGVGLPVRSLICVPHLKLSDLKE